MAYAYARPQTIGNDLLGKLNAAMLSNQPVTAFELASWKRDVEKLKSANATEGWLADAALTALQWDENHTQYSVNNLLKLKPNDSELKAEAAKYLWDAGLYEQAFALTRQAFLKGQGSKDIVEAYAAMAAAMGDMPALEQAEQQAEKMGTSAGEPYGELAEQDTERHTQRQAHMAAAGVGNEDIAREAQMALAVLKQYQKRFQSVEVIHSFDPEDDACSISLIYTFHGSWSDEVQLEEALTEQQAQDPRWTPGKLLVAFHAIPQQ